MYYFRHFQRFSVIFRENFEILGKFAERVLDLRNLCVCFKGFVRSYSIDNLSSISVLPSENHKVRKSIFSEFS